MVLGIPTYLYLAQIREWLRTKHRHYTLKVGRIDVTQLNDKFKPLSLDPVEVEFEVIHLKRAKATLSVSEGSRQSEFNAILEFRGSTLILTRSAGELGANWVGEALETDYLRRYGDHDILFPVATLENGKIAHFTVDEPEKFLEYLHLLHTLSVVQIRRIPSRRAKDLRKFTKSV